MRNPDEQEQEEIETLESADELEPEVANDEGAEDPEDAATEELEQEIP